MGDTFSILKKSVSTLNIFSKIYFTEGNNTFKYHELTHLTHTIYEEYDYAVKYYPSEDVCLIFNLAARRNLNAMPSTISITAQDFNIDKTLYDGFYYKGIRKTNQQEKIIVIPSDLLREVLQNISVYFQENEYDGKDFLEDLDDTLETKLRKRESITRLVRSALFSKKVLKMYDYECAICRCNIPEVLQAAHIVPIKERGSDKLENGICLCANHHLMFDNDILKIDFKNLTLRDVKDEAKAMPWYREFIQKYNAQIKEANYGKKN